jgi:hypothetical protein
LILGAALNEGPAFLALIAHMVEGNPIALGLGGVLALGVAVRIPTLFRIAQWIEGQIQQVLQERQFGRQRHLQAFFPLFADLRQFVDPPPDRVLRRLLCANRPKSGPSAMRFAAALR